MKKLFTSLAAVICCAQIWAQSPVTIVETGVGYTSLDEAVTGVTDGQTITINEDITYKGTINPNGKSFTIIGVGGTSLTHTKAGLLLNIDSKYNGGSVTVKNLNIRYAGGETTSNYIQQNTGSLYLENVSISDFHTTVSNGIIRIYSTPASTVIDNVSFINCSVTDDYYLLNAANNYGVTLRGTWDYTIRLNNTTAYVIDGGVTNDRPAAINFAKRNAGVKVVEGCTDMLKFYALNTTNGFTVADGNLVASAYSKYVAIEGDKVTGVTSLPNAANAITTEGTVLLYADADVTGAISAGGKTISFRGVRPSITINRAQDRNIGNAGSANTHLTFRDLNITTSLEASTQYLFQATVANSSVTLKNITISGVHNTGANVLARANAGGVLHFDGVTCVDCSVENDAPLFTVNQNGCTLSGANSGLSIRLGQAASATIDASGLIAGQTPVSITLANSQNAFALFSGCSDPELFTIVNSGWSLTPNAMGGLSLLDAKVGSPDVAALFPTTKETVSSFYTFEGGQMIYPWCIRLDESTTTLTFNVPDGFDLYYRIDPYDRLSDDPFLDDHLKEHPEGAPEGYSVRTMAEDAENGMTLYTAPVEVPTERNLLLTLVDRNNINNTASQILQVLPSNLVQTGVETIAVDCAEAEYYTLGGRRVSADSLVPGIYVVRRGNSASKVMIR